MPFAARAVASGYFARGNGIDLGSWWEFRSGAELDYRFANRSRLGVAVHHMSNAGLTQRNAGEESVTLLEYGTATFLLSYPGRCRRPETVS